MSDFTHFDTDGNAVMVDVSGKPATVRQAVATGRILMSEQCFAAVRAGRIGKGDVLGVARIAGIMALKRTPEWIPLCHTIPIEKAAVDFALLDELCAVEVRCTVRTTGATGVEMEALTGVTAALLTVYDMCKAVDKSMRIEGVHLVEKTGGKSGVYRYADTRRADGTPGGEGVL